MSPANSDFTKFIKRGVTPRRFIGAKKKKSQKIRQSVSQKKVSEDPLRKLIFLAQNYEKPHILTHVSTKYPISSIFVLET